MMQFWEHVDLWIVGAYMLAMLVVAWWVSDSANTAEGYTVGNRGMSGWAVGLSVLATFTSSISFLAVPATTYAKNWNANVFALAVPVAAIVAVRWFVPLYRRETQLSAYELLEERFGYWARLFADASYMLMQLVRVAMVLLLVAIATSPMLGLGIVTTLVVLGILVIIYDTLGGIQAVIWTDVWQVLILIVGAGWCLATLTFGWPGGVGQFFADIPPGKLSHGAWPDGEYFSLNLALSTFGVVFLYGISENLRNYGTDQNYVQRMLAARSDAAARGSIWLGAVSYVPLSAMFCMIGTALFMNREGMNLPEGIRPEQVFPHFIQHGLSKPVAGLVIAAILAAAMSTIDSSLNSTSTVIFADVFRRFRRSAQPRIPEIVTLRATTVTLGLCGTGLAVLLHEKYQREAETLLNMWWQYAGTLGAGLFGLFLVAWLLPRCPAWAAATATAVSIPVLVWGTIARDIPVQSAWKALECPLHPNLIGIAGTAVLIAIGAAATLAARAGWIAENPRAVRSSLAEKPGD